VVDLTAVRFLFFTALVHESEPARNDPNPEARQLLIA
jgi:hypothetical protein